MTAKLPTEAQRDRAEKLGKLAAREGKAVTVCPFPVDGAPADRVLAARFVAGYVKAGGVVDGMSLGDEDQGAKPDKQPRPPAAGLFDHLGY